mgnify:CR=1 FL=1
MPSTNITSQLLKWTADQRNLTIFTAILVAVPTAFAFRARFGDGAFAGSFLLLITLAVSVPTAYDRYWPRYTRLWKAVAWVLVACAVVAVEFTVLYVLGTEMLELVPLHAAISAFLVTDLGNFAWLAVWKSQ